VTDEDEESRFRREQWHNANAAYGVMLARYLIEKERQGVITQDEFTSIWALGSAEIIGSNRDDRMERAWQVKRDSLLRRRPELRAELNERMRHWPRNAKLTRAMQEYSQIRKFLNAQFDLERLTLAQEQTVVSAGDVALKRYLTELGASEVTEIDGDRAVEAANSTMKHKLREICPHLRNEVDKLGFSWVR
jgi:hypothetical protein